MRSRPARLGTVAVGLVALLGTTAPPAQATTILSAVFTGIAILDGPLGYPCTETTGTVLLIVTSLCPTAKVNADDNIGTVPNPLTLAGSTLTTVSHLTNPPQLNTTLLHLVTWAALTQPPLTLPGPTPIPNPTHWPDFHHNKRNVVGLFPTTCEDVAVNLNKLTKAPTHAGACTFALTTGSLPNTVAGNCGLSSGQVTVTFTDALGQTFTLDVHFVGFPTLVIEGHSVKVTGGQTGLVVGVVEVIPPLPVVGDGTSCINKTATNFQLVGTIAIAG